MKTILLTVAVVFGMAAGVHAQDFDRPSSEAQRMKNQITQTTTAKGLARLSTRVYNGFGTKQITAPLQGVGGDTAPTGPPRSQSASFGVSASTPTTKPFASVSAAPTISPYMGLFDEGFGEFNDLDYHTVVRPAIQQRQFNQQVVRQAQMINRRVTAMAARNAYNTSGNQNVMPTGHAATFNYHSRFYPSARQRRR